MMINGAGATFPYPVYAKWFANYTRENPSVQIRYDPIGSAAGIRKLLIVCDTPAEFETIRAAVAGVDIEILEAHGVSADTPKNTTKCRQG